MADYRGRRIRLPINWSARQLAILEMAARDYRESVAESTVEPVPHSDRPQQHHHNLPSSVRPFTQTSSQRLTHFTDKHPQQRPCWCSYQRRRGSRHV